MMQKSATSNSHYPVNDDNEPNTITVNEPAISTKDDSHPPVVEEVIETEESMVPTPEVEVSGNDDSKLDKYKRNKRHPITALIIFCILQLLAVFFVIVATPIEMYKLHNRWRDRIYPELVGSNTPICVTAWGMKRGCRSNSYYSRDYTTDFCYKVRVNFRVVEAFCIMTIAIMIIALAFGVMSVMQIVGKGPTGTIAVIAVLFAVIPWGIITGMYYQRPCCQTWYRVTPENTTDFDVSYTYCNGTYVTWGNQTVPNFSEMSSYGAGFGLLVTAWTLEVIAAICAFLPF